MIGNHPLSIIHQVTIKDNRKIIPLDHDVVSLGFVTKRVLRSIFLGAGDSRSLKAAKGVLSDSKSLQYVNNSTLSIKLEGIKYDIVLSG